MGIVHVASTCVCLLHKTDPGRGKGRERGEGERESTARTSAKVGKNIRHAIYD